MTENNCFNEKTGRKIVSADGGTAQVTTTPKEDSTRLECEVKILVIPVIFLPGIMGTNLKANDKADTDNTFKSEHLWKPHIKLEQENSNTTQLTKQAESIIASAQKGEGEKVWKVSGNPLGLLWKHGPAFMSSRQRRFNPEKTMVDYCPDAYTPRYIDASVTDSAHKKALALMRGWGSVGEGTYWDFLSNLQESLDKIPQSTKSKDKIKMPEQSLLDKINIFSSPEESAWQTLFDSADGKIPIPKGQSPDDKFPSFASIYAPKQKKGFDQSKHIFGKQKPSKPTDEDMKKAYQYQYIVYASGYNWLNCNWVSANGGKRIVEQGEEDYEGADQLHKVVETIIANINKECDKECKKVILITHSMGGLVGRAYAKKHPDKVLGVIHGVIPPTGAAPMYKRMRAGFDGAVSMVLGGNAAKTSLILTHSVGALELAPNRNYGDSELVRLLSMTQKDTKIKEGAKNYKQWLQLTLEKGNTVMSLPIQDPYKEIYRSDKWYGLVPDYSGFNIKGKPLENTLIDPTGVFNYKDFETKEPLSDRKYFNANIDMASKFHSTHLPSNGDTYHSNTYACCTIEEKFKTFGRVVWHGVNMETLPKTEKTIVNKDTAIENLTTKDAVTTKNESTTWKMALETWEYTIRNSEGDEEIHQRSVGTGYMCITPDGNYKRDTNELKIELSEGADASDSTVPGISAIAPAQYIKELWQISDEKHGHENAWQAENAQLFALYAISKIMKEAT